MKSLDRPQPPVSPGKLQVGLGRQGLAHCGVSPGFSTAPYQAPDPTAKSVVQDTDETLKPHNLLPSHLDLGGPGHRTAALRPFAVQPRSKAAAGHTLSPRGWGTAMQAGSAAKNSSERR